MPALKTTHVYKEVNGCSIRADVFLPSNENPPVVLFFHGGALISGTRKYLPGYQMRALIRAGLAVVSFDYRLAPETGLEEIIADVRDAVRWAKGEGASLFHFNPDRVVVMGGSAGGYLSLMTGTFDVKPSAIVAFYGYGDILGAWYTQPSEYYNRMPAITWEEAQQTVGGKERSMGGNRRYTYYFYLRQQGTWPEAVSGNHPLKNRERLLPYCPVYNIGPDYPPALLLHGDQDTDVPFEQSKQMAAALEKQGIENQLVIVNGAGHMFDADGKNPEMKRLFDRVVQFLQDHV